MSTNAFPFKTDRLGRVSKRTQLKYFKKFLQRNNQYVRGLERWYTVKIFYFKREKRGYNSI